ncbi:MAG: tryptophan 7-halogenase [Flavobacteriia bacterium]|nr:tryptophan 7-halogenase [Flavobacteriia bacterium]
MEEVDVLVIGAGPAGTIAASIIHQNGFRVKIIEKEKFPRFVIGESLLPRCMEALDEAKCLDAVKNYGFQEKFGAKFVKGSEICDFEFSDQFTQGWSWTWQVNRAEFDQILANEIQKQGVDIQFENEVQNIDFKTNEVITSIKNLEGKTAQIKSKFIVDSSGYGRVIPRLLSLDRESTLPKRKTLFAHIKDPKRLDYDEPNRITIIIHTPTTWIWVIPFSNGVTSVGFVGDISFFDKLDGLSPTEQLLNLIYSDSHLKERFENAEFIFEPKTIVGWSITSEKFYGDGYVLTGNVTEFLDPVFSSGVTLATVSSQLAAHLVVKKMKGIEVDWEKEYMKPMLDGVDVFRTYINAWYEGTLHEIFFAKNIDLDIKKQICSVLAGYVWDLTNPFVKKHKTILDTLVKVIRLN